MSKPFRILSLDGGGIRGAFSAAFLAETERELDIRIADHFDLIAGTSTGAIIAVALALGERAERVFALYQQHGPAIFKRKPHAGVELIRRLAIWTDDGLGAVGIKGLGLPLRVGLPVARWFTDRFLSRFGLSFDALLQPRYESLGLEKALGELLGQRTLEQAKTKVVVPAVDLTSGKPVVFKTPHLPDAKTRDNYFSAAQIALASAAAPTYFPHSTIRSGSAYCDGGLWANNPALAGIVEALRIGDVARANGERGVELGDIQLLSVGTGQRHYSISPPSESAGLVWWGPQILDVVLESQSAATQLMAGFLLPGRHHRVDFNLPDKTWRLDNAEKIEQLIHLGTEAAHEHMAQIRSEFFAKQLRAAG